MVCHGWYMLTFIILGGFLIALSFLYALRDVSFLLRSTLKRNLYEYMNPYKSKAMAPLPPWDYLFALGILSSERPNSSRWGDLKRPHTELLPCAASPKTPNPPHLKVTAGGFVTWRAASHSIGSTRADEAAAMTDLLSAFQPWHS